MRGRTRYALQIEREQRLEKKVGELVALVRDMTRESKYKPSVRSQVDANLDNTIRFLINQKRKAGLL